MEIIRQADGTFHWEGVQVREYKQEGSAPFRDVTRQVLFEAEGLPAQLRYFEVAAGGWTTLERHEHVHAVMVIRGRGQALVGDRAYDIKLHDLVSVPPMTWHQFHAAPGENSSGRAASWAIIVSSPPSVVKSPSFSLR